MWQLLNLGLFWRTCCRQLVPSWRKERERNWPVETVDIITGEEGSEKYSDDSSGTGGGTEDVIEVELCDELSELDDGLFNDLDY